MKLTVELLARHLKIQSEDIDEVAICLDEDGLKKLISELEKLALKKDHLHLMTAEWAGNTLTSNPVGGDEYVLVNHLRIVKI